METSYIFRTTILNIASNAMTVIEYILRIPHSFCPHKKFVVFVTPVPDKNIYIYYHRIYQQRADNKFIHIDDNRLAK